MLVCAWVNGTASVWVLGPWWRYKKHYRSIHVSAWVALVLCLLWHSHHSKVLEVCSTSRSCTFLHQIELPKLQVNFPVVTETRRKKTLQEEDLCSTGLWIEIFVTVSTFLHTCLLFFISPSASLSWQLPFCWCEVLSCYRESRFHACLLTADACSEPTT